LGYVPRQRNVFYELIDEADEARTTAPADANRLPTLPIIR
jgi:hypothetical protein